MKNPWFKIQHKYARNNLYCNAPRSTDALVYFLAELSQLRIIETSSYPRTTIASIWIDDIPVHLMISMYLRHRWLLPHV